jgi:hypothetical protein
MVRHQTNQTPPAPPALCRRSVALINRGAALFFAEFLRPRPLQAFSFRCSAHGLPLRDMATSGRHIRVTEDLCTGGNVRTFAKTRSTLNAPRPAFAALQRPFHKPRRPSNLGISRPASNPTLQPPDHPNAEQQPSAAPPPPTTRTTPGKPHRHAAPHQQPHPPTNAATRPPRSYVAAGKAQCPE